ncbi:hypothetical protein [Brucella rhizosphaerae]|uniref:hypothetical protein n=1 Tax=Brucella rhizosphaerae TaxID=571254 RepID=UPI000463F06A|nr:hypothetical protein [Brucella rhizosphaerae]
MANPAIDLQDAPLPRGQRAIVEALASVHPRRMFINDLVDNVYQLDPNGGPENAHQTVLVQIHYLRKTLPAYGWTIPKRQRGVEPNGYYRLAPVANDNVEPQRSAA